jgi:hypothetical protein
MAKDRDSDVAAQAQSRLTSSYAEGVRAGVDTSTSNSPGART